MSTIYISSTITVCLFSHMISTNRMRVKLSLVRKAWRSCRMWRSNCTNWRRHLPQNKICPGSVNVLANPTRTPQWSARSITPMFETRVFARRLHYAVCLPDLMQSKSQWSVSTLTAAKVMIIKFHSWSYHAITMNTSPSPRGSARNGCMINVLPKVQIVTPGSMLLSQALAKMTPKETWSYVPYALSWLFPFYYPKNKEDD